MRRTNSFRFAGSALLALAASLSLTGAAAAQGGSASLTIGHEAIPDDVQDFTYTVDLLTQGGFQQLGMMLDDDAGAAGGDSVLAKDKSLRIPAGDIQIIQSDPGPGWTLDAINCSGSGSASPNTSEHRVTLNAAAGATITCKFINARTSAPQTGEIRIVKDAMPNSLADFGIAGSGPGFAHAFVLDDDAGVPGADNRRANSRAFIVPAGTYTFNEALATGWVTTGITCTPNAAAVVDEPNRKVTITIGAGQIVTCTYRSKPVAPQPCTGFPLNVTITFQSRPYSWGPQIVHICRGGTVTFQNAGFSGDFTVTPSTPTGSFVPVPLAGGLSRGTTTPFQTAGTFQYFWSAHAPQGMIVVH